MSATVLAVAGYDGRPSVRLELWSKGHPYEFTQYARDEQALEREKAEIQAIAREKAGRDRAMDFVCDSRYRPKRTWTKKLFTDRSFARSQVAIKVPAWLAVLFLVLGIGDSRY